MIPKLNVIVCSTRPGRIGSTIAAWFAETARADARFDVDLVDLATFRMPLYDEPNHPRLRRYEHAHTKAWSASVEAADAYVFVAPEYNYGPTPALVNALSYLWAEWHHKPAGFVSYGGVSGGLRAVQTTKLTLGALKIVPVTEAVVIPLVTTQIQDGAFVPSALQSDAATVMLHELLRWTHALQPLRQSAP